MNTSDELRHLLKGVEPGEKAKGLGIALFKVNCPGDANNVLKRCQEVLEIVLRQDNKNWPSDDKWQILLPEWFVARCAPERTLEEEEQLLELWQKLSPEEQRIASSEEQWAISEWIYWFQPEERQWFWWDAFAESDNVFHLAVEALGWPFPWSALDWLVRASGATNIQPEMLED